MAMMSGVISKIHSKDTGTEDQYGNKFLRSFKLDGSDEWYGVGKGKKAAITLKVGAGYHDLAEGDTISFFYESSEYNGKMYNNVKSSKISLDKAGGGAKPAAAAPAARTSAPAATAAAPRPAGAFSGNELSIKSGRAVNAAISLVTSGYFTGSLEDALVKVVAFEKYADSNYNDIYLAVVNGDKLADKVSEIAKQQQEEAQQAADDGDFDDNVPF